MTTLDLRSRTAPDIIAVIARHGAWPVLVQALRALAAPPGRPSHPPMRLPDCPHLRRDIGLDPLPPAPPSRDVPWIRV